MTKLIPRSKIQQKINSFQKGRKIGPIYNSTTKTWTNSAGQQLKLGKLYHIKNSTYATEYTPDGYAIVWEIKNGKHFVNARAGTGAKRRYIGGSPNQARQKYLDQNKEFTDSIKTIAKRYGINPNLLASRIAKEGPIDRLIQQYNQNQGYDVYHIDRTSGNGMEWGLDDSYTDIKNGMEIKEPWVRGRLRQDEAINEKGRIVYPVIFDKWSDGISVTAAELKMRRDYLKNKFPYLSDSQLDRMSSAAFNQGIYGVSNKIKQGKQFMEYTPFIQIK